MMDKRPAARPGCEIEWTTEDGRLVGSAVVDGVLLKATGSPGMTDAEARKVIRDFIEGTDVRA